MKPQPHMACLLALALVASLMAPGLEAALAIGGVSAAATIGPASPVQTAEDAAIDATVTVWSDSDPLSFDVSPVDGLNESDTRRITLTVTATQPYALRLAAGGNLAIVDTSMANAGAELSPAVMRFAPYGSTNWQPLSSVPTTVAEEPDVTGLQEHTYSFVFEAFADIAPGWYLSAGAYEAGVMFDVVPLVVAAPAPAAMAAPEVAVSSANGTDSAAVAIDQPAPEVPVAGKLPESWESSPATLPVVVLQGAVTATLTSDPEANTGFLFWLADTELTPISTALTPAELVNYRLFLTLDGVAVTELVPGVFSGLYAGSWDTTGVVQGVHRLAVLAVIDEPDPGVVCWAADIEVVVPGAQVPEGALLPVDVPATTEGSVAPVPTPVPDADPATQSAESGGAAG